MASFFVEQNPNPMATFSDLEVLSALQYGTIFHSNCKPLFLYDAILLFELTILLENVVVIKTSQEGVRRWI
jgi:hypothetical protein